MRAHNNGGKALIHREFYGASTLAFQFEMCKICEPVVRDRGSAERQATERGQFTGVGKSDSGDARFAEDERFEPSEPTNVLQVAVLDWRARKIK